MAINLASKTMNKVKRLFKAKGGQPRLSPYTVAHEKLDEFILGDMLDHSKRFKEAVDRTVTIERQEDDGTVHYDTYEQAPDLRSDLFFASHVGSDAVEMDDPNNVRPSSYLNAEIMRHYVQQDDFLKTRPMTRNDPVGSALATMAAQETLEEELRTTLADHAQTMGEASTEEERIREQQNLIDSIRQQIKDMRANGQNPDQALIDAMKEAIAQREDAKQKLDQIVQGFPSIGGAVSEAVAAAAQSGKELAEVYVSLPGVGVGAGQHVPPEAAIELAMQWRHAPSLKKMAELIGRFERDFRYKRSNRVVGGDDIVVGVETGNELRKILPMELASFGHPVLKAKFYRDFAARQLLQYEMVGEAEAGKGPIVICIDASGSMGGAKNEWARAVALAVCSIAQREKRAVYAIEFASVVTNEWLLLTKKQGIDPEVATDFAMSFNGGGTDITEALDKAKEICSRVEEFRTADVLLITDGSDYMQEDDLELKRWFNDNGVRLQGVVIGMDTTPYTAEICDDEVAVFDLTAPSEATDRIITGIT